MCDWALYGLMDLDSVYALEVMFWSADGAATGATDFKSASECGSVQLEV